MKFKMSYDLKRKSCIVSCLFYFTILVTRGQTLVSNTWHGFEKVNFSIDGRPAYIVKPPKPLAGNPWLWQAYFPDWHYEMDSILVSKGYHIAYINCSDLFGNPASMQAWEKFYQHLISNYAFSKKPVLEGVSRGGLYVYAWAKRNPDKVSFIYAEAPVLDIKSWPGGKGSGRGSGEDWKKCLAAYEFTEAQAMDFKDNPIDHIESLAAYKVPIIHVVCRKDSIVPVTENTDILERKIVQAGGYMIVDEMNDHVSLQGHHFDITDPGHYATMIMNKTLPVRENIDSGPFIELNGGLNNTFSNVMLKKELTVAFLGGSITYNPGWRDKLCRFFRESYPQTTFRFIPAGIPSLGSLPHSFRLQSDVLDKGPIDLLFIEAAVNDHANSTMESIQRNAMEGIIRHAYTVNPSMNIVLMAFADEDKLNDYKKGIEPLEVKVHRQLAEYYHLPFINLAHEVYERIKHHEFSWKEDFKDLHPSPFGQHVYFQSMKTMVQFAEGKYQGENTVVLKLPKPINKTAYDKGMYVDVRKADMLKGFSVTPTWNPSDQKETREGFVHVPVLEAATAGSRMHFNFEGNAVGIAIVSGPDAGVIEYRIDNGRTATLNLFTPWSNSLHLPWYFVLGDGLKNGKHQLDITVSATKGKGGGQACRIVHFLVNKY
jgi:sialidase-1